MGRRGQIEDWRAEKGLPGAKYGEGRGKIEIGSIQWRAEKGEQRGDG
jgi:hypothetical protein